MSDTSDCFKNSVSMHGELKRAISSKLITFLRKNLKFQARYHSSMRSIFLIILEIIFLIKSALVVPGIWGYFRYAAEARRRVECVAENFKVFHVDTVSISMNVWRRQIVEGWVEACWIHSTCFQGKIRWLVKEEGLEDFFVDLFTA